MLRDVTDVTDALKKQGFYVTTVLNPTRAVFDQAMRKFINEYGQAAQTRLLIYFAGHGHTLTTVDGRELGYVVPADAPGPRTRIHYPALGLAVDHRRTDDLAGALIPDWLAPALAEAG